MLRIVHQANLSHKPIGSANQPGAPFSFHSLIDEHKAQNSQPLDKSTSADSSNFIQELRAALPDRLSKNVRNFKHRHLEKVSTTDFGIPTVFVKSLKVFLIQHHCQSGLSARELLKRLGHTTALSRVFLKLTNQQGSGIYYVQLKEEPTLDFRDESLQVVSLEKIKWAFPDPSEQISEAFFYEVLPEWGLATIEHVTMHIVVGDFDFIPSFQYLVSYFDSVAMSPAGWFEVDVPTLDGKFATLQLKASEFGMIRGTSAFKDSCAVPEPKSKLDFVEGWFGVPGLRLVNFCKSIDCRGMGARLGILSGSSGVGKSFLVSKIVSNLGIPCHTIHPADSPLKPAHLFNKPGLLIFENAHESYAADLVDMLRGMPNLLVLFITSCPAKLHANLVSKVDFHIELDHPTNIQRRTILKDILANSSIDPTLLDRLAEACPGFLMADLKTLVTATLAKHPPSLENFLTAKRLLRYTLPQSQKIPKVFFSQIGGLDLAKAVLKRLASRLLRPSNIAGGKGALMYGPPGTGKTLLGKALATEASANFLPVRIPDLIRGEIGGSEKALSRLFSEARSSSPCIMFLDELEALFVNRAKSESTHGSRLVAQFILELDTLDSSVIILATTNHPLAIDLSVLRPGRIDHHIYLPPPSPQERADIFEILFPGLAGDLPLLAQVLALTNGFTGADLSALNHRAQVLAYHRSPNASITSDDVLSALDPNAPCPLVPSVSASQLEEFRLFQNPC